VFLVESLQLLNINESIYVTEELNGYRGHFVCCYAKYCHAHV